MMWADLFEEFDTMAQEYGWAALGQPQQHVRRYGKAAGDAQVTVTAYSNRSGTAVRRVMRTTIDTEGVRTARTLHPRDRGKREQVTLWLRWSREDRHVDA